MAAGDITVSTADVAGSTRFATGTVEVDNTFRAFTVLPTVHSILIFLAQDQTGAGNAEVRKNQNASGTTVNGMVSIAGNHTSTEIYNFLCVYK